MPNPSTFHDLPDTFLTSLSDLLALRDVSTLGQLNAVNRRIKAVSLSSLWRHCKLPLGYPVERITESNCSVVPLIRALRLQLSHYPLNFPWNVAFLPYSQSHSPPNLTLESLRLQFPNLQSLILTHHGDTAIGDGIRSSTLIPLYHSSTPTHFFLEHPPFAELWLCVTSASLNGLIAAMEIDGAVMGGSRGTVDRVHLVIKDQSEDSLYSALKFLTKAYPALRQLTLSVDLPSNKFYSQAEWVKSIPLLLRLSNLQKITYNADRLPGEPVIPINFNTDPAPSYAFLDHLCGTIGRATPAFETLVIRLPGEEDRFWVYVWGMRRGVDGQYGEAVRSVQTTGLDGMEIPWEEE